MKILLVEDHVPFADQVKGRIAKIAEVRSLRHVRSRDEAINEIKNNFFDLLILDLSILETSETISPDFRFGHDVFKSAQKYAPGLPTFLLTTSDPDDGLMALMRETDKYDIWGERREIATLDYFQKERSTERLFSEIEKIAASVASLEAIPINTRGRQLGLTEGQERAVRLFTRMRGAEAIEILPLSGGLSQAKVVHGLAKNRGDRVIASTVIKLGPCYAIEQESRAFDKHVGNLPNGVFTPKLDTILKGTCGTGAIVYSLAEKYNHNLFELLSKSDDDAANALIKVASSLMRWKEAGETRDCSVKELRHRLLWDADFQIICDRLGLDLHHFEQGNVRHRYSCIHADLHGGNILVDDEGTPILIDFGEVEHGASALDPVSLGLSIYFHPDAVALGLRDKAIDALPLWLNIDDYIAAHPFPAFARRYRDWAYDVGGGDSAVLACAYAYLLRQLKFDKVDHAVTIKLLEDIKLAFSKLN